MLRPLLVLLRLHDATAVERRATGWTAALFFCVLAAYYLLRPLREQVGTAFGTDHLTWLFTLTWVILTVLNPLYMLLANRLPARRFLRLVLHGFALSFLGLAVATLLLPPLTKGAPDWARPEVLVAAFFYSWVTAFSVCGVTLVWVHAVDWFSTEQGKRLFGLVSVGGTLGAIAASALAWVSSQVDRPFVLVGAAVLVELGVLCYGRSLQACERLVGGERPAVPAVASAGVLHGFTMVFRSRYLLGITGFVLLAAVVATSMYYALQGLVGAQITDDAERRALFAQINLFQNCASLVLQVWVTRAALLRFGVAAVLCSMPVVSLCGFGLAALVPAVGLFAVYEVLRRTTQFAFDKPAREVLFTPLDQEAKYKAKAFIDTLVLRTGDLLGSWANEGVTRLALGGPQLLLVAGPVVAFWGWLGLWLGRQCRRQERGRG